MDLHNGKEIKAKISIIQAMSIFGTIGIFIRNIPFSSAMIAAVRGLIGAGFLYVFTLIKKGNVSWISVKNNIKILIWSGIFIGINWIFLFEAYRYTTVATATLCYYLAPVFIILMSPLFLKEELTIRKLVCTFIALIGMFFVSGVFKGGINIYQIKGILYGTAAALLYAGVIILNKKLENIDAYDMTILQLLTAGLTVLPYAVLSGRIIEGTVSTTGIVLLIIVSIIHTGINYAVYFGAVKRLKVQTAAIFSYIDPVVAIFLSNQILKEQMDLYGVIGAVLILGATLVSEIK